MSGGMDVKPKTNKASRQKSLVRRQKNLDAKGWAGNGKARGENVWGSRAPGD